MGNECRHRSTFQEVRGLDDEGFRIVIASFCTHCKARLPLGPSNDLDTLNHRTEINAARIVAAHESGGSEIDYLSTVTDLDQLAIDWPESWLALEIAGRVPDADAWPWDVTRPVAGQYEEWLMTQRPVVELPVLAEKTIASLAADVVKAGGSLPYLGTPAEWSADPDLDDAIRAVTPHDPTGSAVTVDPEDKAYFDALDDIELPRVEADIRAMENES